MHKGKTILLLVIFLVSILPGTVYAQDDGDIFTIGLLIYNINSFVESMESLGYAEGQDVEYRIISYEGVEMEQFAEHEAQQRQLIIADESVDLFVTVNDSEAKALSEQRPDVPVVFTISDDPVVNGVVADITTPGGNLTGLISNSHHERRLQLLQEIDPSLDKVYYLYQEDMPDSLAVLERMEALADELEIELVLAPVVDLESGLEALENTPEDTDWLFITPYIPFDTVEFGTVLQAKSEELNIPIAGFLTYTMPGYLVNYGPDFEVSASQAAQIVDVIIRGAAPGDVPVAIAENTLIINLEVAEARGVDVPVAVLRQADLIIRPEEEAN